MAPPAAAAPGRGPGSVCATTLPMPAIARAASRIDTRRVSELKRDIRSHSFSFVLKGTKGASDYVRNSSSGSRWRNSKVPVLLGCGNDFYQYLVPEARK